MWSSLWGYIKKDLNFQPIPKQRVITLTYIAVWCCLIAAIGIVFNIPHRWPIGISCMFYYMWDKGDIRRVPGIFTASIFGILLAWMLVVMTRWLTPYMGYEIAVMVPVLIATVLIIAGKQFLKYFVNNATSAFFLICLIDSNLLLDNVLYYILMVIIGGGIRMIGYVGISKLRTWQVMRLAQKKGVTVEELTTVKAKKVQTYAEPYMHDIHRRHEEIVKEHLEEAERNRQYLLKSGEVLKQEQAQKNETAQTPEGEQSLMRADEALKAADEALLKAAEALKAAKAAIRGQEGEATA